MTFKQIATTTLFSALLLSAPAAMAQDPQGYGQPPQSAAAAQPADDATVTSFAEAMGEVQVIQQKFSEQLQGVEDNDKARELQMKAQEEMVTAVEASGEPDGSGSGAEGKSREKASVPVTDDTHYGPAPAGPILWTVSCQGPDDTPSHTSGFFCVCRMGLVGSRVILPTGYLLW